MLGVWRLLGAVAIAILAAALFGSQIHAQSTGEFSLQVSPSPLVTTIKPGQTSDLELTVRNTGTTTENLKIEPRSFAFNDSDGSVNLNDTAPAEIANWISFSNPKFTVAPGGVFIEKIHITVPKDAGFSYSFALIISRQDTPKPTENGRIIKASIAVFTLINIDRPGAVRKLDVVELESAKQVYEYLPATIKVKFRNTGNTIVQPYGNIFIQRGKDSNDPIATLPVNENKGYILPGSTRTMETTWVSGFPVIKTNPDGSTTEVWDWSKVADFRFGLYTAKLVGVYNDGGRDVPIETDVTFWVLPWKIILGALVIIGLVVFAIWSIVRKIIHKITSKRQKHKVVEP